jgi:hypothetical protein
MISSSSFGPIRGSALDQYYSATMGPLGGGQGTVLGHGVDTFTPSSNLQSGTK